MSVRRGLAKGSTQLANPRLPFSLSMFLDVVWPLSSISDIRLVYFSCFFFPNLHARDCDEYKRPRMTSSCAGPACFLVFI